MGDGAPIPVHPIADDEVHVWEADLDRGPWPPLRGLPRAERERGERLRRPLSRRRWVAARWALRGVLGHYLGARPAAIELRVEVGGKPRLADPAAPLRFNLSHSRGLAAVIVAREREVGVDVEWIDRWRDVEALAASALGGAGRREVRAAPAAARAAAFHLAWARREAIGKCFGVGLATPPRGRPIAVAPIELPTGFAGAIAIAGMERPPVRRFAIDERLVPRPLAAVRVARGRR